MTLTEFVNTYLGVEVGTGECVALIKQYESDVLGLIPESVGNAVDYYRNYSTTPFLYDNYILTTYTGSELPNVGDIAIWDETYGGGYGHVAIVYSNINSSSFISFDQNWTQRKGELITHTYAHLLGYLTPRTPIPPTPADYTFSKFNWAIFTKRIRERRVKNARKRF